jgi:hypothetical protein
MDVVKYFLGDNYKIQIITLYIGTFSVLQDVNGVSVV